ncbi:MAG TPA: penicillin-binding protein 2 [Gaiellaceae bacterium]|nr:penicillin-binding protein 2 [Gaiellaceae bacterium]
MVSHSGTPGAPRRFLPPDPRVEEPYLLTPQLALRVAILAFLALAIFAVLFVRLWALQILSGQRYLAQANDNRVRTLRIDAPRGAILDRSGHVLVSNVVGERVELWPADLPKTWPAELRELRALQHVTGVPVRDMLRWMNQHGDDPLTPVVIQTGLHPDQVFYLSERRAEFPGVQLAKSWLRSYPHRSLAAQVLGYVGQISPSEYKRLESQGYQPTDSIGQAGVELNYDSYLRGHDGTAQLTVDSRGRPKSAAKMEVLPRSGDALRLTLDLGLQRAAEHALRYGVQLARLDGEAYADGGAIVALDPRDGSVLAMASYPTYQPSIFVGRPNAKKLAPLLNEKVAEHDNHPGLNRAIDAAYPPGSTFKPVTALAAMQEHLLSPDEEIPCTPTFTAYKQVFHNWTPLIDTRMDLESALAESCDTYFYELGRRFYVLPPDRGHPLQLWANRFGLGEPTGIDLSPESDGLIPTPEWRRRNYKTEIDRTWKPGYSIQLAIGQGQVTVTPLQMARLYAMIANGGKLVTPHVAEDVEQTGSNGQPERVLRRFGGQLPESTGVDPTALRYVQQGLYQATHSTLGTSSGVFGSFPVPIAGKTGSAEKLVSMPGYPNPLNLTQSWWCGYGPFDAPTIVVCAVIENGGHGGVAAAPAALKVFEQYFHETAPTTVHASD